ncbi:MAG: carbon storage regulator CsrA [Clostridia bacterium]|nr:carbon storage regulator CsrA [Clostridia bacterium]
MLVLTRRKGDSLMIGDEIEVTVVEIQGDKVKIGISAPRNITVLRKELVSEATDANQEAASPDIDLGLLARSLEK